MLPAHAAHGRRLARRNDFTTPTKENKVKPTEHIAKAAVTPKIGRFATLRGLLQAQGSGALCAQSGCCAARRPLCFAGALCRRRPSRTSQAHLLRIVQRARGASGWCRCGRLWRPVRVESLGSELWPLDGGQARSFRQLALAAVPVWVCALLGCCGEPDERRRVRARRRRRLLSRPRRDDLRLRPQHGRVAVVV